MQSFMTKSYAETEEVGSKLAGQLKGGSVVALFGDLGAGKTAFVRGIATGLGLKSEVSSPTFALVHEYGGKPPLVHFDMYRVTGWDDLYTTGFFDYIDSGAILAVEWSENIEAALPENTIRVNIIKLDDNCRKIEIILP
jgi:tRNA threonylcarbamoyladenosine biosynthesis protein TsaE